MNFNWQTYTKWIVVVLLNSILGLLLSGASNLMQLAGMLSGIATWWLIYVSLDIHFLNSNRLDLSRRLLIAAVLRALLQLTGIDMFAGLLAISLYEMLGLVSFDFLGFYLTTFLTGLFLSIICGLLYLLCGFFIQQKVAG